MIDRIMGGIEITPETLGLDVIDAVGAGGNYFGEEHTVRHFRENWFPKLLSRRNYEQWEAAGGLLLGDKANERVREILREHQPRPLAPEVVAELDEMEKSWWREVS
jgi:trimethylamine--corrinoid protein Co-methyltransferase